MASFPIVALVLVANWARIPGRIDQAIGVRVARPATTVRFALASAILAFIIIETQASGVNALAISRAMCRAVIGWV